MASDGAEVAEDYRLALEDLSSNMRSEISNLTVIARENTEHALAIAEVLQQHILKAPPNKKLPALYVMDSIVKNVGTPYTLYFGRNLFKTFMESYAVVDHGVRRKMEEMLKTWKDPVPGSLDTRPVFSHELVRPIENALMKARAASMPQQQPQGPLPGRSRPNMFPHRNTPTPPGGRVFTEASGGYPQQQSSQQQQMPFYPSHSAPPSHSPTPVPFQSGPPGPALGLGLGPGPGPYGPAGAVTPGAGISVENLSNDIQNLIGALKAEFSQNPHDSSVQNRLRALLDLQGVVQHTNLPPDQLELIKHKVTELAVTLRAPPPPPLAHHNPAYTTPTPPALVSQTPVSHTHTHAHAHVAQNLPSTSVALPPVTAAPAAAGDPVTLDFLLGKGATAALLGMQSAMSQGAAPTQPPSSFGNVAIQSPPALHAEAPKSAIPRHAVSTQPQPPTPPQAAPAAAAAAAAPGSAFSVLEQLRAAGILPAVTPNTAAAAPPPAPPAALPPSGLAGLPAGLPPSIVNFLAAQKREAVVVPVPVPGTVGAAFIDATALKQQFRPDAIRALYDDLGPPCTQCGRRFRTDEEGKKKKTAHMDWHFKVHQRSTEAEKRGTHRSWYVDQQDWQNAREAVDAIHDVTTKDQAAPATKDSEAPKYIPVPDPSSNINNVCPICQDRFENKWLDTAQEWVWLDTVLVGSRAYHASCHAEATRDRDEPTPGVSVSRRTPEPVLGKRKAEGVLGSPKMRVQKTFA